MDRFVELFEAVINPLLALFAKPATGPILVAVLLIAGIVCWIWFWFEEIKRAHRQIEALSELMSRGKSPIDAPSHFIAAGRQAAVVSWLKPAWDEFDKTIIPLRRPGGDIIALTRRPDEYFNRAACGLTYSGWHALPNWFVGIGLLLTFLGLVAALQQASGALGGDVQTALLKLGTMFQIATNKFLTSIAGLLVSILLSMIVNRGVKKIDVAFDGLCRAIERATEFTTTEGIASEQLEQLVAQTTEIKKFNTDTGMQIVDGLASRLDASLADSLTRAIEPLHGAIRELTSNLGQQNQDAVADMVEQFKNHLSAGVGDEIRATAETIGTMRGALETVVEQLHDGAAQSTAMMAAKVQEASSGLAADVSRVGGMLAQSLAPLAARLEEFGDSVERLKQVVHADGSALDRIAEQARAGADAMGHAAGLLRHSAEPVAEAAGALTTAARQMGETQAGLEALQATSRALADRLASLSAQLERAWDAYAGRFETVDEQLERVFTTFVDGTRTYQETVESFVTRLDQSLDKAVGGLGVTLSQLDESVADLGEHIDKLVQPRPK